MLWATCTQVGGCLDTWHAFRTPTAVAAGLWTTPHAAPSCMIPAGVRRDHVPPLTPHAAAPHRRLAQRHRGCGLSGGGAVDAQAALAAAHVLHHSVLLVHHLQPHVQHAPPANRGRQQPGSGRQSGRHSHTGATTQHACNAGAGEQGRSPCKDHIYICQAQQICGSCPTWGRGCGRWCSPSRPPGCQT